MLFDSFRRRMTNQSEALSIAKIQQSDGIMNATFKRDTAYRKVLVTHAPSDIYGVAYDAKYLVNKYFSITGDNIDYYLQLRPHVRIPLGSYIDIPNDIGVLERWLVVAEDDRPQFFQYYILKCNWILKWMHDGMVYQCLGVKRTQNNYNSGVWRDYLTTTVENQTKMWLPTTPLTQTIGYDNRVLMNDEGRTIPLAWLVTKVEDTSPVGLTKLTFAQQVADLEEDCAKFGIANYCKCNVLAVSKPVACTSCPLGKPTIIDAGISLTTPRKISGEVIVNGKTKTLRVDGQPKTFKSKFWNCETGEIDTDNPQWTIEFRDVATTYCSLSATISDGTLQIVSDDVTKIAENEYNFIHNEDDAPFCDIVIGLEDEGISIKCNKLYSMVGKFIRVSAASGSSKAHIDMEVVS